jgi:hypothetical protein
MTYLQVAQLSELFVALLQPTLEWFDLLVHNPVRSNVTTLREGFPTDLAGIWSFTSVPSLVCLALLERKTVTISCRYCSP